MNFKPTTLMAYNPKHLLERIIEIQNIVLANRSTGNSQVWAYRHLVNPRFHISEATFKNYMSRNAKRELRELTEKSRRDDTLLTVDFNLRDGAATLNS
jgi:hypothetical protein